jgi:hypothetical protein
MFDARVTFSKYDVRGHLPLHIYIQRIFLALAIVLYQFDTVQIEYTMVIPSDDLRFFNPLRASLNSSLCLRPHSLCRTRLRFARMPSGTSLDLISS